MIKAYLSITPHADTRDREIVERISQVLATCGFEMVYIRRDIEQWGAIILPSNELMAAIFDAIRSCQILVVDVTEKGVAIGIDVGYAYAHSIPVFTIAQAGTEISPTLYGLSSAVGFYHNLQDMYDCFVQLGLLG